MSKLFKRIGRAAMFFVLTGQLLVGTVLAQQQAYDGYTYDFWGSSVPSRAGYFPKDIYFGMDMGTKDIIGGEDLFVYQNTLYLLDSNSKSVLSINSDYQVTSVLSQFYNADGSQYIMKEPTGMYIRNDVMYIADKGNGCVIRCSLDGKIQYIYQRPETALLDDVTEFKPIKVVADDVGNCYVLCEGIYQGFVNYDKNGKYIGFFGGNQVQLSSNMFSAFFWKKLLSREQAKNMIRFVPVEYSNAYIVGDFIYTVTKSNTNSLNEVQKLNPIGKNVLHFPLNDAAYPKNNFGDVETAYYKQTLYDSQLVDIQVDEDDFITVLDFERGRLFQYDQECNIVAIFGSVGDQKGNFINPTAVEKFNGTYVVLDKAKQNLTTFEETEYMTYVREGLRYYNKGIKLNSLEEMMEPWEKVLQMNSNYRLAYLNIGRALSQQGLYKEALPYFKLAESRKEYSQAFRMVRTQFVKQYFVGIVVAVIVVLVLLIGFIRFAKRKLGFERKKVKMVFK